MKKKFLYWGVPIILTIYLSFNVIAKHAFEIVSSHILGTKVTIHEVKTKLLAGSFHIKDLNIYNPGKFNEPCLFEAEKIDLTMRLSSLLSNIIEIEDLKFINANITYELDSELSIQDNIDIIKQNIKNHAGDNDEHKTEKKVILHNLIINNCKFKFNLAEPKTHTISLPNLKIKGIGVDENGVYLKQAGWQILLQILVKG